MSKEPTLNELAERFAEDYCSVCPFKKAIAKSFKEGYMTKQWEVNEGKDELLKKMQKLLEEAEREKR